MADGGGPLTPEERAEIEDFFQSFEPPMYTRAGVAKDNALRLWSALAAAEAARDEAQRERDSTEAAYQQQWRYVLWLHENWVDKRAVLRALSPRPAGQETGSKDVVNAGWLPPDGGWTEAKP